MSALYVVTILNAAYNKVSLVLLKIYVIILALHCYYFFFHSFVVVAGAIHLSVVVYIHVVK